jgi:tetratricopeptide (TPR) repeat protein
MKMRVLPILALLLIGAPVAAATLQQDFDAAQAQLDARNYAAARTGFAALLDRVGQQSRNRSAMIIRNRLGQSLLGLGEIEAAAEQHEVALAGLPAGNPAAKDERATALTQLAIVEEQLGQIGAALNHWQGMLAEKLLPDGSMDQLAARIGVARTGIWRQPRESEAAIADLLALPAASLGSDPVAQDSIRLLLLRLRAQLFLNEGRLDAAEADLLQATKLAGGTGSLKVNIEDVRVRSDLALLAWLRKDLAGVAKYSQLSGAAMLDDGSNRGGVAGALPPCAPTGNLAPDAMALIEFTVRDDGSVLNVQPIYAQPGSGPADSHPEEQFAAAVRSWSWPAEEAKATNALWRAAIRVEVRCLTQQPDIVLPSLGKDYERWLQARTLDAADTGGTETVRRKRALDRLAAVDAAQGAQTPAAVPPLVSLLQNSAVTGNERKLFARRLSALAEAHDAPVLLRWLAGSAPRRPDNDRQLIALAEARGETRMADYLRLSQMGNKTGATVEADLAAIAARHPDGDPLRTQALIMLSDRAFARGEAELAASALARTGLSDQQCALVDVRPLSRNASFSDSDFPREALAWGLSAMVRGSYDITPTGKTSNVRVIMARPPFVFSDALVKRAQSFTFMPVLRGTETVGCQGRTFPVRFKATN